MNHSRLVMNYSTVAVTELQSLLSPEWRDCLAAELAKPYWNDIVAALHSSAPQVLPPINYIFAALNACPPSTVKVVILGQDPYIHVGEAHGYSFSVSTSYKGRQPPSLSNIIRELRDEYGIDDNIETATSLSKWADEGVLLLNTVLTVREGKSGSHFNIGWEQFTQAVIRWIDMNRTVVFMAWGNSAQKVFASRRPEGSKRKSNANTFTWRNRILTAGHPSPLNTTNQFRGCNCFRDANEMLLESGQLPVRWLIIFDMRDTI